MEIRSCPDCGEEQSPEAESCPHCGVSLQNQAETGREETWADAVFWMILTMLLLLVFII